MPPKAAEIFLSSSNVWSLPDYDTINFSKSISSFFLPLLFCDTVFRQSIDKQAGLCYDNILNIGELVFQAERKE